MTDHNREALIEEAAKSMYAPRVWTAAGEAHQSRYRSMARSALAVFEKAHTPTVIERHDLLMDEDQGPAANCHNCVGAGGYEDHDGEWAECTCQLPEPQAEPKAHDRDDMGICRHCGRGISAREVLDGERPCAGSSIGARDALIEGAKLDARNSMRSDPRVWHEALEAALDKVLPSFWDAALRAAGEVRP